MKEIGKIISFQNTHQSEGFHTKVEDFKDVPFDIKRTYWTYDIPAGAARGGHAHKECLEVIIAASGSFTVILDDGTRKEAFHLNRPDEGLLVNTGIWRTLEDFSAGSVCFVLASELYDADDYIYEYEDFLEYTKERAVMITIKRYDSTTDRERWNQFVALSKQATFLLHRSYMDYHSDRFHDHSLMIFRNDKLYALLPANENGDTFYSHQGLTYAGLITNEKASAEDVCLVFVAINEYLKQAGFRKCIYKPIPWIYQQQPAEEDLYALFKECHAQICVRNISAVINLKHPLKWYNIRKSGARKALAKGIVVEESEDYESFWNILSENLMNTYHAHPVHTLQEIKQLHASLPDNIKLYVARDESGKMLGGTVLYISPKVVHTQYISASEEGKQQHALDALFQYLIQTRYKDFDYFDFGTSNEEGGKVLNTSLIYQKEGFGGRGVAYDTYEWTL